MKDKDRCKKWINAVRRLNWTPSKYSRLCSEHFTPDDYRGPGMNVPHLKESAVPSIFKGFPAHLQKPPVKPRLRVKRTLEIPTFEVSLQEQERPPNIQNDLDSVPLTKKRKQLPQSPKTLRLRKKIKTLNQKVRRRNRKISSLQELVKLLKKKNLLEQHTSNIIENHFEGPLNEIFKNELLNKNKNVKGRRYSSAIKHFALTLLYYSPRAYNFCR